MIGQSPRRKEDERLLLGQGRFVDDIRFPGLLHLVLVRSPHARARLVRVDVSAARARPGVAAFVSDDLPELAAPQPALARGEVRHLGEAVAVVLADDRYRAADAGAAVAVEYEPWPAVVDTEG